MQKQKYCYTLKLKSHKINLQKVDIKSQSVSFLQKPSMLSYSIFNIHTNTLSHSGSALLNSDSFNVQFDSNKMRRAFNNAPYPYKNKIPITATCLFSLE